MKITCHHPASKYGVPVILDDEGHVMDYVPGLVAVLDRIGWTRQQAAESSGYRSARSLEDIFQGRRMPSAQLLNVLGVELERLTSV